MNEEIIAGIKNALERGESLDEAMQSFINSGYKSVEVREAVNSLTGSATPLMNPGASVQQMPMSPQAVSSSSLGSEASVVQPASQSSPFAIAPIPLKVSGGTDKKKVIFLVVLLLVLVGILIATVLYKDKILSAFS